MSDLINRQAAIDAIERNAYRHTYIDQIVDIINDLPSVQPRTGKWIDETFKPWGPVFHPYKCDQCGEHSEVPSNFCPNCGAEMCQIEGGEEE